jgi:hypothetical protein
MKKLLLIFAFIIVLLLGVGLGSDSNISRAKYIEEETKEFEDEIIKPGNNYHNNSGATPGINNRIAKAGGSIISDIFDFSFDLLKDLIG